MLDQLQVNLLSKVRHDPRGILLDAPKTQRSQQVKEDEALEALLEFRPEHPVRQLQPALTQKVGSRQFAGLMPAKAANGIGHNLTTQILKLRLGLNAPC